VGTGARDENRLFRKLHPCVAFEIMQNNLQPYGIREKRVISEVVKMT
jgi:hypothetical protein